MRITIDISDLTEEKWLDSEYDGLDLDSREEMKHLKNSIIEQYLSGGKGTSSPNPRTSGRFHSVCKNITENWVVDRIKEWYEANGYDIRISMCKLEDLEDVIESEFSRDIFMEYVWLSPVIEDDMPWLIVNKRELELLREELCDEDKDKHTTDICHNMGESYRRNPSVDFELKTIGGE